jgi:hypothetical protein
MAPEAVRLKFFNLSRANSAELFDRALKAFLAHPGWEALRLQAGTENAQRHPGGTLRCCIGCGVLA